MTAPNMPPRNPAIQGTAITEKHYIAKATESPDLTAALEQFGGQESDNGPTA
ncbi:hypothetical protein OOZ51_00500 [Arthrobacter sp. MI7-26]|uniref:hypothetical protein n=1 Tax=Arthrobacter sp. MI7-26 TaxID=2993653 RepID=UPI002249103C|nr:hypothetical protein [Arthrobacter sp. MI7-26]MCX2746292.1 hypothetical protein [Arthrobacter sp. MI7-26]